LRNKFAKFKTLQTLFSDTRGGTHKDKSGFETKKFVEKLRNSMESFCLKSGFIFMNTTFGVCELKIKQKLLIINLFLSSPTLAKLKPVVLFT
jgi:hypothetical protein